MSFAPPSPGDLSVVVPSVRTDVAAWLAGAAPEAHLVPAVVPGAPGLALRDQLQPAAARLHTLPRDLRPLSELAARLAVPWARLGAAERYLAGVARAVLAGAPLVALEQPAGALALRRLSRLVTDLRAAGRGVLVLERRLQIVAALEAPVWLLDLANPMGPYPSAGIVDDDAAQTLCFGGTLEVAQQTP